MSATTAPPKPVKLILIVDPFRAREKRRAFRSVAWTPALNLEHLLRAEGWPVDEHVWVVWRGKRYDPAEWDQVKPGPGDMVTAVHDPLGIEAALIAVGVSAFLASAIAVVVNIGIAVGLSLLAQKLIGKPDPPEFGNSPTYSFGAIQNTTRDGSVIPVLYGEHRIGGQVLAVIPDKNEGGDDTLRMLIGLCEGPINSIAGLTGEKNELTGSQVPDGINVNGNPANDIQGVKIWTRLGTRDQSPVPGFDEQVNLVEVGLELPKNDVTLQTTTVPVDAFKVIFFHPEGLYLRSRSGKLYSNSVTYRVRWRRTGDSTFQQDETLTITRKKTAPFTSSYRNDGPGETFGSPVQVDIEITKLSRDSDARHKMNIDWQQTLEITKEQALIYPNVALLGLEVEATGDVNGDLPRVTTVAQGKVFWTWDRTDDDPETSEGTFEYSVNPAECLYDWLLNVRYGGGDIFTRCDIDLASFSAWANYCEESIDNLRGTGTLYNRWELGLVIDTVQPFWDVVQAICAAGRARPYLAGNIVKVVIQRERDPVALIAAPNIEEDSYSIQYISPEELPNWVEVQILDAENSYEHATVSLEDPTRLTDPTVPIRKETTQLRGVTDYGRAARAAQFMLNVGTKQISSLQVVGAIDALILEPGDVFRFARNIPSDQAFAGRVISSATAAITLDEDLTIAAGEEWVIYVWTDGAAAETIQQRQVVMPEGTHAAGTSLVLVSDWDGGDAPAAGDVYIARENTNTEQRHSLWEVVSVELTRDLKRQIGAIVYDATIFDDVPPFLVDNQAPDPPDAGKIPPNPTNLSLIEGGTAGSPVLSVSWVPAPWPFTYPMQVWMRDVTEDVDGLGLEATVLSSSPFLEIEGLDIGHQYIISIVPCSANGAIHRDPNLGLIGSITLTGDVEFADDPTNVACSQAGDAVNLSWTAVDENSPFVAYEIRRGQEWAIAEKLQDITNRGATSAQVLRWADGLERFWVRTRDSSGRYSPGERTATCELTLDTTSGTGRSVDLQRDEVGLTWPGSKTDVEVDVGDGALILSASQTSGVYETPDIDLSSVATRRIELNMQGEQLDDERTWDSTALSWDEATFTWDSDEAAQSWDQTDLLWDAGEAARLSWAGDLTTVLTTATITVAVSDSPTPTNFQPLVQGQELSFRYLRFRITLTRDDATNRRVRITGADLTISS